MIKINQISQILLETRVNIGIPLHIQEKKSHKKKCKKQRRMKKKKKKRWLHCLRASEQAEEKNMSEWKYLVRHSKE